MALELTKDTAALMTSDEDPAILATISRTEAEWTGNFSMTLTGRDRDHNVSLMQRWSIGVKRSDEGDLAFVEAPVQSVDLRDEGAAEWAVTVALLDEAFIVQVEGGATVNVYWSAYLEGLIEYPDPEVEVEP